MNHGPHYHTYPMLECKSGFEWWIAPGVWRGLKAEGRKIIDELRRDKKPFRLRVDVTPAEIQVPA